MNHLARGPASAGIDSKARWSEEQGPQFTGDATAEARGGPRIKPARYRPLPGRTYRQSRQALLRRPRASATDRRRAPFVSQTPMPEAGA
jgi:hypothetical protein